MMIEASRVIPSVPKQVYDFAREVALMQSDKPVTWVRFSKNEKCPLPKRYVQGFSGCVKVDRVRQEICITVIRSGESPIFQDRVTTVKHSSTTILDDKMSFIGVLPTAFKRKKIDRAEREQLFSLMVTAVQIHQELDRDFPDTFTTPPEYFQESCHRSYKI